MQQNLPDLSNLPEWIVWLGGFVGVVLATIAKLGYDKGKAQKPADTAALVTGLELGNRLQTDQLIAAVKDVAQAIRDKKQDEMEETMRDLLEELKRREVR